MAIDLTCDVSSKRITPGVINLKEFENGTTSMIWTVSSRYTTGLVDLNDFDAYLILSVRGHIDQIKLTKVLNADDSISLTWDVGTLSTFLVGYAKYQIVFKAMVSGSLYVTCPTDANANGTYTVQNPEAIQSLRTYINDHNYRIFIGSSGKWTLENTSAVTVAYKLIESVLPSGDNWNNCTVADTTATVFNTYEALMYVSESIASDPSMMAQFPTMLRQWELLLSDKIMSSGLNAVRYEVTEAMFTANSGPGSTYFLKLEDIDTTGKPGLIIGAEAFQLEEYGYYTQIANCNFSDNWAGSAGITVPEAFNGYVVVYYSEGGGRWVDTRERIAEVIEHDYSLSGNGTFATPLGINNPLQYVKGNTDYGGTLTDNLDTLIRNTPFTCLGTATGAPDASYSWFGWHINSNAGTAAAAQIAYAFNSNAIICYERVKTSGTWGAWKLRGSTMQIQTFGSGALTAFPGIFYVASSLTDFVLTLAPSIGGEYHIKFTTAATIGTIDLSVVTSWIGSAPTIAAGKTYELDILDGVGVMAEVS